jgi:hypothetical protein
LTATDVAYAQFALESRAGSERDDMWERLALAMTREPSPAPREPYEACIFSFERVTGSQGQSASTAPATVDLPRSGSCSR